MAKPDGEPAFPIQEQMQPAVDGVNAWLSPGQRGMSLRDYFAGQALTGLLAAGEMWGTFENYASCALSHADAMLAEREKR